MRFDRRSRGVRLFTVVGCLVGAIASSGGVCKAESAKSQEELKKRFLKEYPQAFERLKKSLRNVTCKVHRKRTDYEAETVYYLKGDSVQEIMTFDDDPSKRLQGYPLVRVNTITPRYAFQLEQYEQNGPFILKTLAKPEDKRNWRYFQVRRLGRIDFYLSATYQVFARTLKDIIDDPTFRILDIKQALQQGRETVTVNFALKFFTHEGEEFTSGRIVLLPELDWALKEYDIRTRILTGSKYVQRYFGRMRYGQLKKKDQRILPKHVRLVIEYGPAGKKPSSVTVDVADIQRVEFDTVAAAQFSLSHFGLPDITENHYPFDHWLFWTFLCLTIACGVALLIRRWKRTGNQPAPA